MNKIVVKFGGSNLKSKSDIDKIIRVIKSYNEPLVIVVSAFYGVTDKLNTLLKSTGNNNAIINEIFEPYYTVLDIENRKQELVNLVNNLNNTPNSVSIKNNILSFGERLSSYLLNQITSVHLKQAEFQLIAIHFFGVIVI